MCKHGDLRTDWSTHQIYCTKCHQKVDPVWAFAITMEKLAEIKKQQSRCCHWPTNLVALPKYQQADGQ